MAHHPNDARESLLREALRPAPTTDAWRGLVDQGGGTAAEGLAGLCLIETSDPAEEALVIALALRQTMEEDNKTAALVTPDRNLRGARRAELTRWEVAIDDSADVPWRIPAPAPSCFCWRKRRKRNLRRCRLLGLLKHPFATLGRRAGDLPQLCKAAGQICAAWPPAGCRAGRDRQGHRPGRRQGASGGDMVGAGCRHPAAAGIGVPTKADQSCGFDPRPSGGGDRPVLQRCQTMPVMARAGWRSGCSICSTP